MIYSATVGAQGTLGGPVPRIALVVSDRAIHGVMAVSSLPGRVGECGISSWLAIAAIVATNTPHSESPKMQRFPLHD
jgi:hypothetical protein